MHVLQTTVLHNMMYTVTHIITKNYVKPVNKTILVLPLHFTVDLNTNLTSAFSILIMHMVSRN